MKNEIEEIINNLQRIADRKCYPEDILDGSIAQEWVDYITNLQEELKSANESISWWQNRFNAVEKENENLKIDNKRLQHNEKVFKSRNEKALDKLYCYGEVFDSKILQEFQEEMENILNNNK